MKRNPDAPFTAEDFKKLIAQGYRRVSNRFGIIARVDRPDWQEYQISKGNPVNADWYRRCVSKDTITIGQSRARKIPPSAFDPIGYVQPISKTGQKVTEGE